MNTTRLASVALLGLLTGLTVLADDPGPDMAAALTACHDEAISTGLEDEADIQAYLNLCMQAWQTPEYPDPSADVPHDVEPYPATTEPHEPPHDDAYDEPPEEHLYEPEGELR